MSVDPQQLQNLEFPILVDFWLPLRDKVTSRFAGIMEKHIAVGVLVMIEGSL